MKELIYIANIRLPTEKAHGLQIMKTCEAFTKHGVSVTLLVPTRRTPIKEDVFAYYDIRSRFPIHRLFSIDMVWMGKFGFWIQSTTFGLSVLLWNAIARNKQAVCYTRDEFIAAILAMCGFRVVWEAHRGETNIWARYVVRKCSVVTISHGLKKRYEEVGATDVLVAPDAVDVEQFSISLNRSEARATLGLTENRLMVLYAGHLYANKGAWMVAEAARVMPEVSFVCVGGTDEDIAVFRRTYGEIPNLRIEGRKPHADIPRYLKAADMLVLPTSARDEISRLYTSPMKLFEYLASGTPILASDVPSLREVLSENTAVFFSPDDSSALVKAISTLVDNAPRAAALSGAARLAAAGHSWDARAANIWSFVTECIGK